MIHMWSASLAEIDWINCFESYGLETPLPRVADMSFDERFEAVLSHSSLDKIFIFILVVLPFIPVLLAHFFSKNEKTILVWVAIIIILAFLSWSLLSDPWSVHSCDRKGTHGFWLLVFINPILFLITTIMAIFVSLTTKEKPLL